MKTIVKIISIASVLLATTSCRKDFLDAKSYASVDTSKAFQSSRDFENAVYGIYATAGDDYFWGRDAIAIGDLAGTTMFMTGSSGHFDAIHTYSFVASEGTLANIYFAGYSIVDQATRLIEEAPKFIATLDTNSSSYRADVALVNLCVGQAYALKSFAYFVMVNVFALPYDPTTTNDQPGIVLINESVDYHAKHEFRRSSVKEVYAKIIEHLDSAMAEPTMVILEKPYLSVNALNALAARIYLYMGDWSTAREYAELVEGDLATKDIYLTMWNSLNETPEDIFYIAKSEDNNLSANSLNTLYGSYNGRVEPGMLGVIMPTDYRRALLFVDNTGARLRSEKFNGIPSSAATNNIPIFRYSEIPLIIAETYAQEGDLPKSIAELVKVAGRNALITADSLTTALTTKEDLLAFIHLERMREFYMEGHNWFDLRRYTTASPRPTMTRLAGHSRKPIANWKAYEFAYPIPQREIDLGVGIEQNEWISKLP